MGIFHKNAGDCEEMSGGQKLFERLPIWVFLRKFVLTKAEAAEYTKAVSDH